MDPTGLKMFAPEIFLCFSMLFQLFLNVLAITNHKNNYPILNMESFTQCLFIVFSVLFLSFNVVIEASFFNFLFNQDSSTFFIKISVILVSLFSLPSIVRSFTNQNLNFFEYFVLFQISVLATLLLISSSNLLSIYLVLEMQTLSFYILACFKRNSAFSTEAGLKYFVIGSFISGLLLFGISIIYGLTGTLNFNELKLLLVLPFSSINYAYFILLQFSILLITVVFLFKVSAVPFHFWSPDVYEGAPLSSTIIFSVLPKFAIFYLFLKWLSIIDNFSNIKNLLLICGLFSVLVGSFMALRQKRLKRLLIYSSIAQTGFLLVALSVYNLESFVSIFFFLIIYLITSILLWTIFSLLFSFQNKVNIFFQRTNFPLFLSTLSSFFKVNKLWSISSIIIFFSLAGIPPLAGFFSKFFIISITVDYKNIFYPLILLIVSAVSVFYYLRIIKIIFFDRTLAVNIESAQIIFNDFFFDFETALLSFFLFLLVFLFFFPSVFILLCNSGVIDFFFY